MVRRPFSGVFTSGQHKGVIGSNNNNEEDGLTYVDLKIRSVSNGEVENLSLQDVAPSKLRQLQNAMRGNNTLVKLNLCQNKLGNFEAWRLASFLRQNNSLTHLNIMMNRIGTSGVKMFAVALTVNKTLVELDLYNNKMGWEGYGAMAKALKVNKTLRRLDLRLNKTSTVAAKFDVKQASVDLLDINTSIRFLELDPFEGGDMIEEILYHRRQEEANKFRATLNSNKKASWNRSRIMFVGQGKAGKTATVRSLLCMKFDPEWDSTIGAKISESTVIDSDHWSIKNGDSQMTGEHATNFAARIMLEQTELRQCRVAEAEEKLESRMYNPSDITDSLSDIENIDTETEKRSSSASVNANQERLRRKERDDAEGGIIARNTPDIFREYDEKLLVDVERDGTPLMLSLWDFGGQQVFYSMHHMFLTREGVYMLVFSMVELLHSANIETVKEYLLFWLKSVRLHAPEASMILVGTFAGKLRSEEDIVTVDRLLRELAKGSFKQIYENRTDNLFYFPIDNKESKGIGTLRTAVEHVVTNDEAVSNKVSIRWMAFLDNILAFDKTSTSSYIKLSDITALANRAGIDSVGERDMALSLFHERGVIIHLNSTCILKDIIVTKPQWLVDEMSKLIRDDTLHKFDLTEIKRRELVDDFHQTYEVGLTTRDFLEFIWEGTGQVDFFIDLMRSTMLLSNWPFNKANVYFLVPSLLHEDQNKMQQSELRNSGFRIVFDFSKSFLPNGVFQRLLCLAVSYSAQFPNVKEPELSRTFALIEFEPGFPVNVFENKKTQTISVVLKREEIAAKIVKIFSSILEKINYDSMGTGLSWRTLLQDPSNGELLSVSKAQEKRVYPWFMEESEADTSSFLHSENIVVDSFLQAL